MSRLIHIGFGNIVNADKIISIVSPDAAPVKRMVQRPRKMAVVWMLLRDARPRQLL